MGRVILVRHGQASFGAAEYDHLSPMGIEQAKLTGTTLAARGVRPHVLLQGGMRRHAQTARSMVEGAGWSDVPIRTVRQWDEIDHQSLMVAYDETPRHTDPRSFQAAYERALRRWMADSHDRTTHEPFPAFVGRIAEGLRLAADEADRKRILVVVSSAGPISIVCASLSHDGFPRHNPFTWLRWNAVTTNCSLTTVIVGRSGTRLFTFNEHGHLAPASITFT